MSNEVAEMARATKTGSPPNSTTTPDGLPDIPKQGPHHTDNGLCMGCLMPARVAVHKRNGYYSACRHCGTRVFTSTAEGTLVFRAMQRVLQDTETIGALQEALSMELKKLALEQRNKD
jgi:hypothetical protein